MPITFLRFSSRKVYPRKLRRSIVYNNDAQRFWSLHANGEGALNIGSTAGTCYKRYIMALIWTFSSKLLEYAGGIVEHRHNLIRCQHDKVCEGEHAHYARGQG